MDFPALCTRYRNGTTDPISLHLVASSSSIWAYVTAHDPRSDFVQWYLTTNLTKCDTHVLKGSQQHYCTILLLLPHYYYYYYCYCYFCSVTKKRPIKINHFKLILEIVFRHSCCSCGTCSQK